MTKQADVSVLDAALLAVRAADGLWVLPSAPVSYAAADGAKLAAVALAPGDFSLGDGDDGARVLTVAGKSDLPVTASGTATHVALVDSSVSKLIYVTTAGAESVAQGGTVDVAEWVVVAAQPGAMPSAPEPEPDPEPEPSGFRLEVPVSFIGASNLSEQHGDGKPVTAWLAEEPDLANPEDIINRASSGKSIDSAFIKGAATTAGANGEAAIFQVGGSNDSDTSPQGRFDAFETLLDNLGHDRWLLMSGIAASGKWLREEDKSQQYMRFIEKVGEKYGEARIVQIRDFQDMADVWPSMDANGDVIADSPDVVEDRRNCLIPRTLRSDSLHANKWGYGIQAEYVYKSALWALGSNYHFPFIPMGKRLYTTDPTSRETDGEITVPFYSPHADALDDCTIEVLDTNGMDTHFEAVITGGAIKLKRLTAGYPGGQSICDVWMRVTKADKSYDVLQRVLLGEPGAFRMVGVNAAALVGFEKLDVANTRKGSFVVAVRYPTDSRQQTIINGIVTGTGNVSRLGSETCYLSVHDGEQGSGTAITAHQNMGKSNPADGDVDFFFMSIDLDGGGTNNYVLDAIRIQPNGSVVTKQGTGTVTSEQRIQLDQLNRLFYSSALNHSGDIRIGLVWACPDHLDFTDTDIRAKFVDGGKIAFDEGCLGEPGNDGGVITVGGNSYTPSTYYGRGNAADWLANRQWGNGVEGEAGRTWFFAPTGEISDEQSLRDPLAPEEPEP